MKRVVIGIDIGGTNTAIGVVDSEAMCYTKEIRIWQLPENGKP